MTACPRPGHAGSRAHRAHAVRSFLPRLALALPLAIGVLPAALSAQQLQPGYGSGIRALPVGTGNLLRVPGGGTVSFDGSQLLLERQGQTPIALLTFPTPVFGSFSMLVDQGNLLFGESSNQDLWLVPLNGPAPTQPLSNLNLNYDAALYATGMAVVSAKTGGWASPDNELYMLNLSTGTAQHFATLPGASGAVAIAANGDLFYATASPLFPAPPGSCDVLRFRRPVVDQALQQNAILGIAQADVVWTGLDAASDLAFDDDGDLLFVDWWNNRVGELNDANGPSPSVETLIDYGFASLGASSLQFVRGLGTTPFEPFQPTNGALFVHETSWGTVSQLRFVQATAPIATINAPDPIPTGAFAVAIGGGPALGYGLAALAFDGPPSPVQIQVPGFEAGLPWDAGMSTSLWTAFVNFDAAGNGQLSLQNPGTPSVVPFRVAVAVVDAAFESLGASAPLTFRLGQ
ncbi:MAG: hypothetical protein RL398_3602 [Planctomycetota bacterium]